MRTRIIVFIVLAIAAASTLALASDIPFDPFSMGLSGLSYGFPTGIVQPSSYQSLLQPDYGLSDISQTYLPSQDHSSSPASFGFPSMSGMSGMSLSPSQIPMVSPIGFPQMQLASMIDQPFQNMGSNSIQGITPSSTGAYTESDNGKTIRIKLGDTIKIQLSARVDLGFTWNLSATDGLNISVSRIYPPQQLNADYSIGSIELVSTQEWEIQAVKPGTQVISATYSQSTVLPNDKKYRLTVIVE